MFLGYCDVRHRFTLRAEEAKILSGQEIFELGGRGFCQEGKSFVSTVKAR